MSATTRDAIHEAVCDLDRQYAVRHPDAGAYVRPALAHELCVPGYRCWYPQMVEVAFLAPGSRTRSPWGIGR